MDVHKERLLLVVIVSFLVGLIEFGCDGKETGLTSGGTPTAEPPQPSPTSALLRPTATPESAGLSLDALLNARYAVDANPPVKFDDGIHYWPCAGDQETCRSAIISDLIASGDLDRDGLTDAALIIGSRYGGSGYFVTLAVALNKRGVPENPASVLLGDRVVVNSVSIEQSQIVLDMLTHPDPDSPEWAGLCCPSVPTILRFRLEGSEFVEVP